MKIQDIYILYYYSELNVKDVNTIMEFFNNMPQPPKAL